MLVWNVYREDFNAREIEVYNVFEHWGFLQDLAKSLRKIDKKEKELKDLPAFAGTKIVGKFRTQLEEMTNEEIRGWCAYYFWSKCEHEVVVTRWPPYVSYEEYMDMTKEIADHNAKYGKNPLTINAWPVSSRKIDIYDQLRLNWEKFVVYIIANKKELYKEAKERKI